VSSRLFTRNASPLTPSANKSTAAAVASSKSIALSRFIGTESAARKSARTNARRLPRRSPHAVATRSAPATNVNVRLWSMTDVGTRRRKASNRSEGWERMAESRSITPWAATASASSERCQT